LFLRIHHFWYYVNRLAPAIRTRQWKWMLYSVRVLVGGAIYHLTGRQPSRRSVFGREIFQTRWSLVRELSRAGLTIAKELDDSTAMAPSFVVVRKRL
jgi:hypothetical protein